MSTNVPPVVKAGEDRNATPFGFLNGTFELKVSAADTGGGLCIYDTLRHAPGGPPLHYHHGQDEWFLVTEGAFEVRVGEATHRLGPGDSVLGPRLVPHAFRNVSRTGRIIVAFQPAGTMEDFFREGARNGPLTPEAFAALSARHGMTVVGPPLG